ncbi:HNH endonuclease [Haloferax volcanii]|uniref:HNH endonuclease n=1 Tax=Haloferax volcanii TaxID=2246 RepID=A0A558GDK7_HALVO|nr:HNH endonuclease [Haloferax alexandrinus]TVT95845.1 HNH endonuclease [Haloferax volcanii]
MFGGGTRYVETLDAVLAFVEAHQPTSDELVGWHRGSFQNVSSRDSIMRRVSYLQQVNWLRSMGLVEKRGDEYALTDDCLQFVESAVDEWADSDWTPSVSDDGIVAGTYETTVHARSVDPEFRATVLSRHDRKCPVSGVDHPGLLDVAHVLSWSDYPEYRADLSNVLALSKTHHAAFDRELFTIDQDYRLRVNPEFETDSDVLQRTIIDREGERISIPEESLNPQYVTQHNAALAWL